MGARDDIKVLKKMEEEGERETACMALLAPTL
jgi:hypothetical protein